MKRLDDFIKLAKEEHIKSGINTKGARISYDEFLILKQAAKTYASYCCKVQIEICTDSAKGKYEVDENLHRNPVADKDSILNAPNVADILNKEESIWEQDTPFPGKPDAC